jgi:hypothetical protein
LLSNFNNYMLPCQKSWFKFNFKIMVYFIKAGCLIKFFGPLNPVTFRTPKIKPTPIVSSFLTCLTYETNWDVCHSLSTCLLLIYISTPQVNVIGLVVAIIWILLTLSDTLGTMYDALDAQLDIVIIASNIKIILLLTQ